MEPGLYVKLPGAFCLLPQSGLYAGGKKEKWRSVGGAQGKLERSAVQSLVGSRAALQCVSSCFLARTFAHFVGPNGVRPRAGAAAATRWAAGPPCSATRSSSVNPSHPHAGGCCFDVVLSLHGESHFWHMLLFPYALIFSSIYSSPVAARMETGSPLWIRSLPHVEARARAVYTASILCSRASFALLRRSRSALDLMVSMCT